MIPRKPTRAKKIGHNEIDIQANVPIANIVAMFEAVREFNA